MIEGLVVKDLAVHQDDRGALFEILHEYEMPRNCMAGASQSHARFGQVYLVQNPARGAVRAFHKHSVLWDYFCLVSGEAKFCFVDDRKSGMQSSRGQVSSLGCMHFPEPRPDPGETFEVVVSGSRPKLIVVPPGIFHGWKSLSDNATLVCIGSEVYDRDKPDEIRVPPNYFNQEFPRDPWEVRGR